MNTIFKKAIKKIMKTGFFRIISIGPDHLSFQHSQRIFCLQRFACPGGYLFRSGYVLEGIKYDYTFESEYTRMGEIKTASFIPDSVNSTDNPDFILRQSLYLIGIIS